MRSQHHYPFLFLTFFVLAFSTKADAQVNFGDGQKYFIIQAQTHGTSAIYSYYSYKINVDSVDKDTVYYTVKNSDMQDYYLKQSNNKVFIKGMGPGYGEINDSVYLLLYDFNLQRGDTLKGELPFRDGKMELVIDSVSQINIGGVNRKIQYLRGESGYVLDNNFTFIEGLGGFSRLSGGIEHYSGFIFEYAEYLGAICLNDTVLLWNYLPPIYSNSPTCDFDLLARKVSVEEDFYKPRFKIFPNPATNRLTIETSGFDFKSVVIIDITGRQVFSKENTNGSQFTMDVSALSEGLYFITINNFSYKFIKQ